MFKGVDSLVEFSNNLVKAVFKRFLEKQTELGVIDKSQLVRLLEELENNSLAELGT